MTRTHDVVTSNWKIVDQQEKSNWILQNASSMFIELDRNGKKNSKKILLGYVPSKMINRLLGIVKEFNLIAEQTYGLKKYQNNNFFQYVIESDYENVHRTFSQALNELSINFVYQDIHHHYYSSSFIPIGFKEHLENGQVSIIKR